MAIINKTTPFESYTSSAPPEKGGALRCMYR